MITIHKRKYNFKTNYFKNTINIFFLNALNYFIILISYTL